MKKQVLAISLGILTLGSFAQKKELKLIEKALNGNDFTSALSSLGSLEGSIMDADEKYKTKFYFLKGKALAGKKEYTAAAKTLNKLLDLEKESGKSTYTGDASTVLSNMIQEVSKEAIDLYNNKKNYKAAAEKFYLTYKLSPQDTSFAYNAAVSAGQAKDYAAALKCYRELNEIGYTGIETQYVATNKATGKEEDLGSKSQRDLMVKTGNYIKPTIKRSQDKSADIVKNIAYILKEQGKTEEAIAAMEKARIANPKDVNLILNEAQLYSEMGRMDKFGELMNDAIALDPNDPTLYYNLGVVNFNSERTEEAKKYYNKAIELNPEYYDAYMNLAVAILSEDKAIIEEMNKNLSNFKKYDALALRQKGVYKEALPYLEKADNLNRTKETVNTLKSIYDVLEMTSKSNEFKALKKSME